MSLPIFEWKSQILSSLVENQVIIVTGEPGCGKSTQLPQFCVDSRELRKKLKVKRIKLAITQPRRVAAIAMAKRVAFERKSKLGQEVGYSIRFDDSTSKQTTIKYLTDGVLLRESMSSCFYSYDVVILDEAHERSLDTDILIGLLKSHLSKHRHFRLIITSATIDVSLFSTFFNNCPVITIPGRQFPIEILHSSCKLDKRVEYTVNAAIRIHLHEGPGDVLVFLTGSDECERAKNRCYEALSQLEAQGTSVASMIILALYGAMSSEEQSKVFQETPEDCRKVVFSTNISETSITLDGIGFVIDCGYVKQKQYNSQTGLESLLIIPISKQQAKQRAGRAGRTASGKCFRLYSESFYASQMPESHQAEIFRSNLSSVILTLKTLGVRSILDFSFLQSPDEQAILDAIKQLYWIEAVDDSGSITLLGKELCKFPLDPTFSRCLVSSIVTDCAEEMIQLVALMSSEQLWTSVSKFDSCALDDFRKCQADFAREEGDHVGVVGVFQEWAKNFKSPRWCEDRFLSFRALRLADEIRRQIRGIMKDVRVPRIQDYELVEEFKATLGAPGARLRLSLCMGFYMNAAREIELGQAGAYMSVKDNRVLHVDRSSSVSLLAAYPKWLIYTQLLGSNPSHGTIKMLSKVKGKWLRHLVPKLEEVDSDKLLGRVSIKRPAEVPEAEAKAADNIENKIEQAKARYLKRKGNR